MKYALLIYTTDKMDKAWNDLSEEQKKSVFGEYLAVYDSPGVIGGGQLQPPGSTTTVRVADGETLLTDGPFVDAKEHLGGYYLFEAADLDAATAVASRIPAARMGGAVEVRPLVEG